MIWGIVIGVGVTLLLVVLLWVAYWTGRVAGAQEQERLLRMKYPVLDEIDRADEEVRAQDEAAHREREIEEALRRGADEGGAP